MGKLTKEELAEIAAADAEIERDFRITHEELRESRERDQKAKLANADDQARSAKESRRAYYEANKDAAKEYQRAYREANKDAIKESRRAYYEANKDAIKERRKRNNT